MDVVRDLWDKMPLYHEAGVPHYWVIAPDRQALRVHRWTPQGYHAVLSAGAADTVQAEPFEALALRVAELFDEG